MKLHIQSSQPYGFSYGNSPLNTEYGNGPYYIPSTYQPFDRSSVALCKLPSLPIRIQQQLLHNNLLGGGAGLCIGWGCACNIGCALERLPKILKIFTRNTESTVDGLRVLILTRCNLKLLLNMPEEKHCFRVTRLERNGHRAEIAKSHVYSTETFSLFDALISNHATISCFITLQDSPES